MTSNLSSIGHPDKITISQQTQHFLELYTNNLSFIPFKLDNERRQFTLDGHLIFIVTKSKGRMTLP
jgi:class 3 adenylate cyclase